MRFRTTLTALLFVLACFMLAFQVGCQSPTEPTVNAAFTPIKDGSLIVRFRNDSTGASHYLWHSGDGQTRSVKEPEFEYGAEGIYLVSLRACPSDNMDSKHCDAYEEHVEVP